MTAPRGLFPAPEFTQNRSLTPLNAHVHLDVYHLSVAAKDQPSAALSHPRDESLLLAITFFKK